MKDKTTNTKFTIDLSDELTQQELESFKTEANKSGAKSLKDHFLNITIKKEGVA